MQVGINFDQIRRRIRTCDYLVVAQLFLQNNFLLTKPLSRNDIKPRLLGHWGTCHGINVAYANLKAAFANQNSPYAYKNLTYAYQNTSSVYQNPTYAYQNSAPAYQNTASANQNSVPAFQFILGPGHGFPALQANLFIDGDLEKVDQNATRNLNGIAYICKNFSWPGGFPSHASPLTPGVICEGGELGYCLGAAYGAALGHPEKLIAVLIGDGELETATALASLNLNKLLASPENGTVLPILHLNGYKISAPTISARKSERELNQLLRGFGFTPLTINGDDPEPFQQAIAAPVKNPFLILKTKKGATGPTEYKGQKIAGNYLAHQIPLKNPKTDPEELKLLEAWLKSYHFEQLYTPEKGFTI